MLNIKQKPDEEEKKVEIDITQLDGSPAPDAVSKVAMGMKAENDEEHTDEYNTEWIQRLKGEKNPDLCSIQESYAKLFEGIAGIMRNMS